MRWAIPAVFGAALLALVATGFSRSDTLAYLTMYLFLLGLGLTTLYALVRFVVWAARR